MTSNYAKTLRVELDTDVKNAYPLLINIVDDNNGQTYLYIRRDEIEPLITCLYVPFAPSVFLTMMTGNCKVEWWGSNDVAFIIQVMCKTIVLHHQKAMELVTLIRHEMSCASSVSKPDALDGANQRRDENLRGVFT